MPFDQTQQPPQVPPGLGYLAQRLGNLELQFALLVTELAVMEKRATDAEQERDDLRKQRERPEEAKESASADQ